MNTINGFCPFCRKHVNFIWTYETEFGGGTHNFSNTSFSSITGSWKTAECPSCFNCILIKFKEKTVEFFPKLLPSPTDKRIPEHIRVDVEEAKKCLSVDAYRACVAMCRRALQAACIEKGAQKKELIDQIEELYQNQVITKDLKELAHTVRWVGNDAVHPNKIDVSMVDAEEILNLAEQLMEVIFVAPSKVKEIKDKRKIANTK